MTKDSIRPVGACSVTAQPLSRVQSLEKIFTVSFQVVKAKSQSSGFLV